MNFEIKGGHGAPDDKVVEALERRIGAGLPQDYREFIFKYNGGYPVPDVFGFMDEIKGRMDASDVNRFLSIGIGGYESIENYLNVYSGRVPCEYLPVAHDSGGNLILIKVLGEGVGGVFFWDHEQEVDSGEKASEYNIYSVSDSFNGFLSSLHDVEE